MQVAWQLSGHGSPRRALRLVPTARTRAGRRRGSRDSLERAGLGPLGDARPALDAGLLRLPVLGFVDWSDPRMLRTADATPPRLAATGWSAATTPTTASTAARRPSWAARSGWPN